MGVVFEALHERIQQRVAIKMLLPEVLEIEDVVSRFEREARAAGQLRSENAARVLDVDISSQGVPFMVMEFLDGNDLSAVLEARLQLPIPESVDYVLQACNAMAEAHAAGIIHRDLKPSNLFLCGGDRPIVKVLDFGISKIENDKDTRVTSTQATVGTPLYMSPEQIRSAKHVDTRTDIWSLGIILYELICGKTPFEGSTAAAAAAICIDQPPRMSTFRSDVPPELERIILIALAKNAHERYQDVQSLAAAIGQYGTGTVRMSGAMTLPAPSVSRPRITNPAHQELASARTVAADSGQQARAKSNATMPGWSTRSGSAKAKSRTVVVAVIAAIFAGALAGIAAVAFRERDDKSVAVASTSIAPVILTAAPSAVPPIPSASVSVAVGPIASAPPHKTATPTVKTGTVRVKPPASSTSHPTTTTTTSSTSAPIHL